MWPGSTVSTGRRPYSQLIDTGSGQVEKDPATKAFHEKAIHSPDMTCFVVEVGCSNASGKDLVEAFAKRHTCVRYKIQGTTVHDALFAQIFELKSTRSELGFAVFHVFVPKKIATIAAACVMTTIASDFAATMSPLVLAGKLTTTFNLHECHPHDGTR